MSEFLCPKCGEKCWRKSVDVEVGVIHGPFGCPACGWSEDAYYDRSVDGVCQAERERPGWFVDKYGGMTHRPDDLPF